MHYHFTTRLKGTLVLTNSLHKDKLLQEDKTLYKFIWIRQGTLAMEIDHLPIVLKKNDILPLTPLHHTVFREVDGKYAALLFNSNFYCIFGHDNEVSCNGLLFHGSAPLRLGVSSAQASMLDEITAKLAGEYSIKDSLQEEMLRILLKRFIITCTRIAREKHAVCPDNEKSFDIVRRYTVLVDRHFKEKKKVQDYADLLHRSPKTLTNLFSLCGQPSPLRVIHERTYTEAKRLLLYTTKSAKEIAAILGFEDLPAFSRFFKNISGESISDYRKREKQE